MGIVIVPYVRLSIRPFVHLSIRPRPERYYSLKISAIGQPPEILGGMTHSAMKQISV